FAEIGSLAGGGTVTIGPSDSSSLLNIVGNGATTFSGKFSGAGSLELDNAASLTLTGASFGGNIGTIGGDLRVPAARAPRSPAARARRPRSAAARSPSAARPSSRAERSPSPTAARSPPPISALPAAQQSPERARA